MSPDDAIAAAISWADPSSPPAVGSVPELSNSVSCPATKTTPPIQQCNKRQQRRPREHRELSFYARTHALMHVVDRVYTVLHTGKARLRVHKQRARCWLKRYTHSPPPLFSPPLAFLPLHPPIQGAVGRTLRYHQRASSVGHY